MHLGQSSVRVFTGLRKVFVWHATFRYGKKFTEQEKLER